MPLVPLDHLPPTARVWVFASTRALDAGDSARLLAEVDRFLVRWNAHGRSLTCAREWRHDRFLIVAVDERAAGASGCSIDGLYRSLFAMESALDTSLVGAGSIFFRGPRREVEAVSRAEFVEMAANGSVSLDTVVFDTTVSTFSECAERFEVPVRQSWHGRLVTNVTRHAV